MARRKAHRPAPAPNQDEHSRRLAAVSPRAADWIKAGALVDLLFDDELMRMTADERLRWFIANQPDDIEDEHGARGNALNGSLLGGDRGSRVDDPRSWANA